ncbi:hypothetical protein L218DRAFT_990952 [Marasmius fiardii PR-910]|nr:hypothetical protein L218DRAFT_990952 [Marasmius fiardii PR-910]
MREVKRKRRKAKEGRCEVEGKMIRGGLTNTVVSADEILREYYYSGKSGGRFDLGDSTVIALPFACFPLQIPNFTSHDSLHVYATDVRPTQHLILQRLKLKENYSPKTKPFREVAKRVLQEILREQMKAFQEAYHNCIEGSYLLVTSNRLGSVVATQVFLTDDPNIDFSTPFLSDTSGIVEFDSKASLPMTNKIGLLEAFWALDNEFASIVSTRPTSPNRRQVGGKSTFAGTDFAVTHIIIATHAPDEDLRKVEQDMKFLADKASKSEGNVGFSWGWDINEVTTTVVIVNGWRSFQESEAWRLEMDEETRAIENRWKENAQIFGFLREHSPEEDLVNQKFKQARETVRKGMERLNGAPVQNSSDGGSGCCYQSAQRNPLEVVAEFKVRPAKRQLTDFPSFESNLCFMLPPGFLTWIVINLSLEIAT